MRVLVFVEHKCDIYEERRRVSLLLENLRIDAKLLILSMDSGKLATYEILVNGAPTTDAIDNALRNEPWWTERHVHVAGLFNSHHRSSLTRHHKKTSTGMNDFAIKKRRTSSVLPQFSAPLSFRTNVPMPDHDDSTDTESQPDSDEDNQGSVLIMPKYSDTAVFEDDEESIVGIRSRQPSGSRIEHSDFDASTFSARYDSRAVEIALDTGASGHMSPTSEIVSSSREDLKDLNGPCKASISFAPPPIDVAHRASVNAAPKPGFNDLPPKAQHLVINELIRSQSDHTGVLFTTLPPPHAGTYKDERKSEDYLEGLAILCDMVPPCILIHSKSLTVTTAL